MSMVTGIFAKKGTWKELSWRKCNINSKKENDQFTVVSKCSDNSDKAVWNLQGQSLPSQGEHGLSEGGEEKITNQFWSHPRQNCTTPPVLIFFENVKNIWIYPNRTKCSLDPSKWPHPEPWSTTTYDVLIDFHFRTKMIIILGPIE